jgi:hypothetical protein
MSSFIQELKNPKTGKKQKAFCIDDYYGQHRYGFGFKKDGTDAAFDNWNPNLQTCDFFNYDEIQN